MIVIISLFVNSTKLTFHKKYKELITYSDILLDIFFILDMLVKMNTGYFDENNNYISNYKSIIINCVKNTKGLNFIANFPFIYFIKNPFFYALKLLRINKIFYHKDNDE